MAIYLTVPGITNSSEDHWQSRWERTFPDHFRRIEQAEWNAPRVNDWIAQIDSEVGRHGEAEVVLVAHSLGCVSVAHWAGRFGRSIRGAMLVAPSDCEGEKYRSTCNSVGFDPIPTKPLPFSSVVVASTNDEWCSFERSRWISDAWGSDLINVGEKGHINPGAGFGEWPEGLEILRRFD